MGIDWKVAPRGPDFPSNPRRLVGRALDTNHAKIPKLRIPAVTYLGWSWPVFIRRRDSSMWQRSIQIYGRPEFPSKKVFVFFGGQQRQAQAGPDCKSERARKGARIFFLFSPYFNYWVCCFIKNTVDFIIFLVFMLWK